MAIDRELCNMTDTKTACQGEYSSLIHCSLQLLCPTRPYKLLWQIRHQGLRQAFQVTVLRIRRAIVSFTGNQRHTKNKTQPPEILNLHPGELVCVRPESEILATLDKCDQCKGLAWMPMMRDYCGKKFKVYKQVNKIVLESTGQIRKLKNTVLLENAVCNGIYGCDRSCFFFWKEAWLERIA
jgi:hypothetical protein